MTSEYHSQPLLILVMASLSFIVFADIPAVERFTFQDDITVGKRVSATCLVTKFAKQVTFRWLKNGREIDDVSENVRIKDDQEFSVLIIDPARLEDIGNYTCVARNSFGSGTYTAYLSIKAPPKWEIDPSDIVATIGDSAVVTCLASGSPAPIITWRKYLENKPSDSSGSLLIPEPGNSSIVKLQGISYAHAGFYECIADNGIPPAIKTNFSITIRDPCSVLLSSCDGI